MAAVTINGNLVQPNAQREGGDQYTPNAARSNYIIVQFKNLLSPEQHDILKARKVILQHYIGAETYVAYYDPEDLEEIRALGFVEYANVYHPELVTDDVLKYKCGIHHDSAEYTTAQDSAGARSEPPGERLFDVLVLLHNNPKRNPDQLKEAVVSELNVEEASVEPGENRLKIFRVNGEKIQQIARIDEVKSIQQVAYAVTYNHVSRKDLDFVDYKLLDKTVTPADYDAEKILVAVGDTGFDLGDIHNQHPAFHNCVKEIKVENSDHPSGADEWGHGTHVAGSVAGNHASSQFGVIKGTAPGAELFFQAMAYITPDAAGNDRSGLLLTPSGPTFWKHAFDKAAFIHSNSWGAGTDVDPTDPTKRIQRRYDSQSVAEDVDTFTRSNSQFLVLFAAGNQGREASITDTKATVGAQATAKNCITVGACESSKTMDSRYHYKDKGAIEGNRNKIASFSNIGPTKNTLAVPASNSRIKPDVVAPGTIIYSALSRFSPLKWQYNNKTGVSQLPDVNGKNTDNLYAFQSGTSMATPLVAGCAAVLRKIALSKVTPGTPVTAALIKAVLINGTMDIHADEDDPAIKHPPSNDQGFGRVNIANSIKHFTDTANCGFLQAPALTATAPNNIKTIPIKIPAPPKSNMKSVLKATMCYNDVAGLSLVNTLVLKATRKETTTGTTTVTTQTKYANTHSDTVPDQQNNVQKVIWDGIPVGAAELVVECTAIRMPALAPDQDFALAWCVEHVSTGLSPLEIALIPLGIAAAVAIGVVIATQV